MSSSYDVIVLGTGGVGSAALDQLAGRGLRVLGLDRHAPPHDRGSSHGETRIIRLAYFEHPDYVPLLRRAYALWEDLGAFAPTERLYEETGLLQVGVPTGELIPGVLRSAREHGLDVERLTPADAEARFPGFRVPPEHEAVFERRAGFLRVERCIAAHLRRATARGAELRAEEVRAWRASGDGVVVETSAARYTADRLVVCAGAWAGPLLASLTLPLQVVRKPLLWFDCPDPRYALGNPGAPCFLHEPRAGEFFYGFCALDGRLKVAEHSGGEPVADPAALDRALRPHDESRVRDFLRAHLPGVSERLLSHAVCMYTLTPDAQFVVDRHPEHPQVAFAAGLSGHGFKLASALGEALADLGTTGRSALPLEFLSLARPGLR